MPGFKAKPPARNATDLISTLTSSPVKTDDNALYQTVFSLINMVSTQAQSYNELLAIMQKEIEAIDTSAESGIPPFFFMGSS